MEEPPSATRSSNIQLGRASKFLKKVSHFRGRIRFPGRKPKDSGDMMDNMGPYLRQTRSMDANMHMMAKPYMSQPMLGLRVDMNDNDDNDDSERSASPGDSSSRAGVGQPRSHHDISLPRHSIGAHESHTHNRDIDGLPTTGKGAQYVTSFILPSGAIATPIAPPVPPKSSVPPRPHTASDSRSDFVGIPGRLLTRQQSMSKILTKALPALQTTPEVSITVTPTMGQVGGPSRQPTLHLDNLPTASPHRFGINRMADAGHGAARLSPTIIARQPPLPILNLPKLVVSSPESPSRTARTSSSKNASDAPSRPGTRRTELNSMPALPLRGQDEPRDGDGDVESDEGDDDDDEFHDAEETECTCDDPNHDHNRDDDRDDDRDGRETPIRRPRGSMDSFASVVSGAQTSEEHTEGSSSQRYGLHLLPDVDTSRIDISFLGDVLNDGSGLASGKGKGKARDQWTDIQTPTQNRFDDDYFSLKSRNTPVLRTPRTEASNVFLDATPIRSGSAGSGARPGIYKHASRSMIDLISIANRNKPIREATDEDSFAVDDEISTKPGSIKGKSRERDDTRNSSKPGSHSDERRNPSPNRGTLAPPHPLQRRRSMPTFTASTDPPPYPSFFPHPHHRPPFQPSARDDVVEGNEPLPPYTNAIYLKAVMPRKMEFTKPGIMARDRKWRRVVCELEGTVFRVYRCPPELAGVGMIGGWWERKVGVGDVAEGISGTGGGSSGVGGRGRREDERDRELSRIAKAEDEAASARVQTHITVAAPPPPPPKATHQQHQHPPDVEAHPDASASQLHGIASSASSKSRLNIVNHLLRPHSRSHNRSQSDVPSPTRSSANTPRSSLSNARPSTSSGSLISGSSSNLMSEASANGTTTVTIPSSSSTSTSRSYPRNASSANAATSSSSSSHSRVRNGESGSDGNNQYLMQNSLPEQRSRDLQLIRAYTLQNAESGLGNDYIKRRNVIRVRMEGEQFLLQAKDMTDVVAWIEGFQAAANVALDLDERVMPRGPLFPRRRRRRGPRREGGPNQPPDPNNGTTSAS